MHFCFINHPLEIYSPSSCGAISIVIREVSEVLTNLGHQVTIITHDLPEAIAAEPKVRAFRMTRKEDLNFFSRRLAGLSWRWNRWEWPYYEKFLDSVKRELRQLHHRPDVVFIHNDFVMLERVGELLPQAAKFLWLHNEVTTKLRDPLATLRSAQGVLCVSHYIREWTRKRYSIPADLIHTVHNGINLKSFYPRDDYLQPVSPLKVLFIGRLDPNKGPDLVVSAVAKLQSEGFSIKLSVAGAAWFYKRDDKDDPYVTSLIAEAKKVGTYLGHLSRTDVAGVIRDHDVSCVPSRSEEPFALTSLEGMASGCALIASNRGGLPEVCGDAAVLIDPHGQDGLYSALKSFCQNREQLIEMKKRAVERASKFSWEKTAQRALEIVASSTT